MTRCKASSRLCRFGIGCLLISIAGCAHSGHSPSGFPLPDGDYVFAHRYAEHPRMPSIDVQVRITGDRIAVVNPVATDVFPAGPLAEGRLMRHASGAWIIAERPEDIDAIEVGCCTDGPETIDPEARVYWTC